MKALIAVITNHKQQYRDKAQAQRDTWVKDVRDIDVRFFLGRGEAKHADEVILDVNDDYKGLREKVRQMFAWALKNGYDYVFKTDDDVYVQPQRLLKAVPVGHDYTGRLRGPSGGWKAPYASGFAYWLSRKAMEIRVNGDIPNDTPEDRSTGTMMATAGIECNADYRYVVATSNKNGTSGAEGPRRGNDVIASCEYSPISMRRVHEEWADLESMGTKRMMPTGTPYDQLCVLVKTFLRDGLLRRCVDSIERYMPGARVIIVDDGYESREKIRWYSDLRERGHSCIWTSFDAGFGAKSNIAIKYYDRPFTLVFSDDFMCDEQVAEGVVKMMDVLRHDPTIGVASGRVDNNPYEADIEVSVREDGLKHLRLVPPKGPLLSVGDVRYRLCDHTVNYNVVRREVFSSVCWDEKYKIGGDHMHFYDQAREGGWKIAWVEGVSVPQMASKPGEVAPEYHEARGRARLALPDLFKRCGWYAFTSLDGRVDTLESVQAWCDSYYRKTPPDIISPRVDMKELRRRKKEHRVALRRERQKSLGIQPVTRVPRKG